MKIQKATDPLVIQGSGPPHSRTFCIGDEDHTLGNALRHVLIRNRQVGFAGYSVPHPAEPVVQLRVQTIAPPNQSGGIGDSIPRGRDPPPATEVVTVACETLFQQCDIVLKKLEALLPEAHTDHQRTLAKLKEWEDVGDGDDDNDDEGGERLTGSSHVGEVMEPSREEAEDDDEEEEEEDEPHQQDEEEEDVVGEDFASDEEMEA